MCQQTFSLLYSNFKKNERLYLEKIEENTIEIKVKMINWKQKIVEKN